ncbi:MAG: PaaI family thioesterase [Deltaproteobacteria bacterium]|nr:PaaI family thioesterase [Deltaproteobacteria bacterium]
MPFNSLIGLRIVRLHADGITIQCAVRDQLRNSAGVLHGGVAAAMADAAVGIALANHFGGRRPMTTTEMKINYLRPIVEGKMIGRSHLLRVGKHLCIGRVDMFDAKRNLAAVAIVTYMLMR